MVQEGFSARRLTWMRSRVLVKSFSFSEQDRSDRLTNVMHVLSKSCEGLALGTSCRGDAASMRPPPEQNKCLGKNLDNVKSLHPSFFPTTAAVADSRWADYTSPPANWLGASWQVLECPEEA